MIVYRNCHHENEASIDDVNWECRYCCNNDPRLFYKYDHIGYGFAVTYCRQCIQADSKTMIETKVVLDEREVLPFELGFQLTPMQQMASDFLLAQFNKQSHCLINAVTGAGKTEMTIDLIAYARANGLNVALVSPRVDVVKELSLRMNGYLKCPQMTNQYVSTLYGGHHDLENMHFIISTIHQLIRFKNYFHLIIVDEIDAFPMTEDLRLHRILNASLNKNGMICYLSATPPKHIQNLCRDATLAIPMRFHKRPLPIPTYRYVNHKQLLKFIKMKIAISKHETLLFFFNDIEAMQQLYEALNIAGGVTVDASDVERHEKIENIRKRQYNYIFTTTILERGFTMENLSVVIINSQLFSWDSLVQISGRVDRKGQSANGTVTFVHQGVSLSMMKATKYISKMNALRANYE